MPGHVDPVLAEAAHQVASGDRHAVTTITAAEVDRPPRTGAAGMSAPVFRRCHIHQRTSMSLLKTIDPNPSFAPQESGPLPERLISGNPTYKTWAQDAARGETIKTGVWEATPGETRSIKGELFEFCHILSGVIELTPEGGEPVVYKAGDSFVMKPGFVGVWKTIETVRKIYLTVS
ncbi:cupin domain-containing protein [Streptomyces sp. Ru72]|uniref:cupin domain-containing protein n=1 Tax=Streptomyces sp. Ru72 TaxID=2080747 RepID=UPI002156270C|nr:cupin domain-containing protein [Streptomyces sp. Ru72]